MHSFRSEQVIADTIEYEPQQKQPLIMTEVSNTVNNQSLKESLTKYFSSSTIWIMSIGAATVVILPSYSDLFQYSAISFGISTIGIIYSLSEALITPFWGLFALFGFGSLSIVFSLSWLRERFGR